MRKEYPKSFIDTVVRALINKGDRTLASISNEFDVPVGTIYNWHAKYNKSDIANSSSARVPDQPGKDNNKISRQDKLNHIIAVNKLGQSKASEYYRKHGLFSSDIELWTKELVSYKYSTEEFTNLKHELAKVKDELSYYKSEVERKNAACSELACLLELEKKSQELALRAKARQ